MRSLPSPARRFPFDAQAGMLPIPVPDCHLVRTAIPYLLVLRQPRCFPQRSDPALILFCKQSFKEISPKRQGHGAGRVAPLSRPVHARQATLHTAFTAYSRVAPQCRFISGIVQKSLTTWGVRSCTISGLHSSRVKDLYAIKDCPEAAGIMPSPSIHPRLGVRSRHHGFHRCALQRIFRPFPESG